MTWQLALAATIGALAGYLIRCIGVAIDAARATKALQADIAAARVASMNAELPEAQPPRLDGQLGAQRHDGPQLLRTRFCPQGYSAKDILGYHDGGARRHAPLYPGGLDAWDARQRFARGSTQQTTRKEAA